MIRPLLVALAAFILAAAVQPLLATHPTGPFGRDPRLFERVLIPIYTNRISEGVFGSQWTETVMIHNGGNEAFVVEPTFCDLPVCPPTPPRIAPGATTEMDLLGIRGSSSFPGVLIFIPRTVAKDVVITERIHELTRASMTWGTEIPIVRENDWIVGDSIDLLNVPLGDPAFRVMLRVYSVPFPGCDFETCVVPVDVDIYEQSGEASRPDVLVGQARATIGFGHWWSGFHPGYVQFPGLHQQVAGLSAAARYRLSVRAAGAGAPLWAFAAITNNATQHVTIAQPR